MPKLAPLSATAHEDRRRHGDRPVLVLCDLVRAKVAVVIVWSAAVPVPGPIGVLGPTVAPRLNPAGYRYAPPHARSGRRVPCIIDSFRG